MFRTERETRLVRALPAFTVMSLTAATTLVMAAPALAAPSAGHGNGLAPAKYSQQGYSQHAPVATAARTTKANPAVGRGLTANLGIGKSPILPMPGTYPGNLTVPSFDQLQLQVAYTDNEGNHTFPCLVGTVDSQLICTTANPIPNGVAYTISPTDGSVVPEGWLQPLPVTATMNTSDPSCTSDQEVVACDGPAIYVPGTWREIGVTVTDSATGDPVSGAAYDLFEGATGGSGSARGAVDARAAAPMVAHATSNGAGQITFAGLHLGGTYSIVQTKTPKRFKRDNKVHVLQVPAVTYANLGQAFNGAVSVAPLPPTLHNDKSGGKVGAKQVIDVLANDVAVSKPLSVMSVTKPTHGTVRLRKDGRIVYRPASGFAGNDSFTYAARNALGGTGTATVSVVVHPDTEVQGEGDVLPFTGSAVSQQMRCALGMILLGLLMTALGARRRPSRLVRR